MGNVVVFDLDETITRKDTTLPFVLGFLRQSRAARLRLPFSLASGLFAFLMQGQKKNLALGLGLAGASRDDVQAFTANFVDELFRNGLKVGALLRVEEHRRAGDVLVLASASLDVYVEEIARRLGIENVTCTKARWAHGRLSARLSGANCKGQEKFGRVTRFFPSEEISVVYSDSFSDLPLMRAAKRAVFVCGRGSSAEARARAMGFETVSW